MTPIFGYAIVGLRRHVSRRYSELRRIEKFKIGSGTLAGLKMGVNRFGSQSL